MTWSKSIGMGVNAVLEQSLPQMSGPVVILHRDFSHGRSAIRNSTTACSFSFHAPVYEPARLSVGTELN